MVVIEIQRCQRRVVCEGLRQGGEVYDLVVIEKQRCQRRVVCEDCRQGGEVCDLVAIESQPCQRRVVCEHCCQGGEVDDLIDTEIQLYQSRVVCQHCRQGREVHDLIAIEIQLCQRRVRHCAPTARERRSCSPMRTAGQDPLAPCSRPRQAQAKRPAESGACCVSLLSVPCEADLQRDFVGVNRLGSGRFLRGDLFHSAARRSRCDLTARALPTAASYPVAVLTLRIALSKLPPPMSWHGAEDGAQATEENAALGLTTSQQQRRQSRVL